MNEQYSETIKELLQDYYQGGTSMEEYRRQRKIIIDQMDKEYNGYKSERSDDLCPGSDAS